MLGLMPRSLRTLALCTVLAALASGFSACAAPAATETALLNGHDLAGWEFISPTPTDLKAIATVAADGSVAVTGKPVGYLATTASHENYRLHVEWRWPAGAPKPGNSGVLLHIASGPIDRNTWPKCFQMQTKIGRVGDLLPMAGATFAEKLSTAPDAKTPQLDRSAPDSEKPAGEWNTCDIVCRGDTIEVTINGVAQNRITKCAPAAGKIGIQLEGLPYELRNLRLSPL